MGGAPGTRSFLASLIACWLLAACGVGSAQPEQAPTTAVRIAAPTSTPTAPAGSGIPPSLDLPASFDDVDVTDIAAWINSEPLSISELARGGRVVLVDFWTYTCVNCLRTLPFLKVWHDRYADAGLTIIGVHSPEFDFERNPDNVQAAVQRLGIAYPVAVDSDRATWQAFNNRFWPTKYLFDHTGRIVHRLFGEGGYAETEDAIRAALAAAGNDLALLPLGGSTEPELAASAHTLTRELHAGYRLGYESTGLFVAQPAYYLAPDSTVLYQDPGERFHNQFYLHGLWRNESEAIVHARTREEFDDYLALKFFATTVNAVIDSRGSAPAVLVIELDGHPLARDEAGQDISYDELGRSVLLITEPRMYQLVRLPEFGPHELKLGFGGEEVAAHSFTFGNYVDGP